MRPPIPALVLATLVAAAGCGDVDGADVPARVFAAASLTEPFRALEQVFEADNPGLWIELHFAGSSKLALQIQEGAPADVFASADEYNMAKVAALAGIASGPIAFAENRLTIIAEKGNPKDISGLADFAREDLTVVVCGPEVPAGRYARRAFESAGVVPRSASDEPNVNAVISKVQFGEVDAGIVYVTDATSAGDSVATVPIPDEHNVVATYPVAILSGGANRTTGEAFLAFLLSERGQAVLRAYGFGQP